MTIRATEIMFVALYAKRKASGMNFLDGDAPKSEKDISEWRIWVEDIFMPLNERVIGSNYRKGISNKRKGRPYMFVKFRSTCRWV